MNETYIEKLPATWLEEKLRRLKLPWFGFTLLVSFLILLIEAPHDLLPGVDNFLHTAVFDCLIIAYALTSWTITKHFLTKCLMSLAALTNEHAPEELKFSPNEWRLSFGLGLLLTFVVNLNTREFGSLIEWMNILAAFIAYSVFGWIFFAFLASAKQITQFIVRITIVNVFDINPFKSVAHWCLSAAAVIMGAISIASLFLGGNILKTANLITYGLAGSLGIFVFFAGMWSTHQHMLANKQREINHINAELQAFHTEILSRIKTGDLERSHALLNVSASLAAHKERLEKIPTWPYTIGSIGGLASSIMIPVLINILSKLF